MKTFWTRAIKRLTSGAIIALLSNFSFSSGAIASSTITQFAPASRPTLAQLPTTLEFVPPPIPDRGRPRGRRSGTASRGSCEATQLPLTALVPTTQVNPGETDTNISTINIAYESVLSLTTQPNPTLWFYTPYPLSETSIAFTLQDEQAQTLYERRWEPTAAGAAGGVVKVQIPETAVMLAEGDRYRWYLTAYCGENTSNFVEGWIERVPAEGLLTEDFAAASPIEKAQTYAQQGIWQDALTQLGTRSPEDTDLEAAWITLLSSVGLEEIAQQPIINCCQ